MARTDAGLSFTKADVEISQDGAVGSWLSLSDFGASIAVSGGERAVGSVNVFNDEIPIQKAGKKSPVQLTVRYVYTEGAVDTGPWATIDSWDAVEGGAIFARYWPGGETAANFLFSTGEAIIVSNSDPGGEAGSGEPVMCELVIACEELAQTAWPSS